ncbi:rhodanese-like domain-containing protein [Luteolibacter algae]|uniref:Rhodanese-like domain-containing protein n=1 Tax=Luteolibacter algae TaxID=454151 RepID=A0ABW5D8I0_9BACT
MVSCAGEPKAIREEIAPGETDREEFIPVSKPVKMPPTNAKLGKISGMDIDELFPLQQSDEVLIYDVRLPYFYKIDHLPGSVNWPYTHYDEEVQKRDPEIQQALAAGKKVVLYCFNLGCPEARNVAKKLARRDYEIHVLSNGIDSWRNAGLPLENKDR